MFQALKKLLHVMPCAVELFMFSCGTRENIYLVLLMKPLAMNCERRGGYSSWQLCTRQKGWQWENLPSHNVVHSNLTNTGFMSHAKISLP